MTDAKKQRKILAGRYMLGEGLSLKQALIKAGYSEQTARCPAANDLSAEACIEMALQSDKKVNPATLTESVKKLLLKRILDADAKKESLSGIARTLEILEKWYGDRRPRPHHMDEPAEFVDKVEWLRGVLGEIERREQPATDGETKEKEE